MAIFHESSNSTRLWVLYTVQYNMLLQLSAVLDYSVQSRAVICVGLHMHENKTHLSAVVLTLLHIHCIKRALAAHHHKMNQKTTDTMTFVHDRYIKLTTDRSVRYVQHAAMPIIVGWQLLQSCQCMSAYERDSDCYTPMPYVIASAKHEVMRRLNCVCLPSVSRVYFDVFCRRTVIRRLYCLLLFFCLFVCRSRRPRNRRTLAAGISYTGFQNVAKFGRLIQGALLYTMA